MTSAIPSQPSRLVDSRYGGSPRCRCAISSFTGDLAMSAYQPLKYCAVGPG